MAHSPSSEAAPQAAEVPSRCRVHRLPGAKPTERGILYRRGGERFLLAWGRVRRAFAGEVGDDAAGRRAIFDLAIELTGPECVLCRMEATPGPEAKRLARTIELAVGAETCSPSLRAVAREGLAPRSHPDLDTLTEAVLESVRFG